MTKVGRAARILISAVLCGVPALGGVPDRPIARATPPQDLRLWYTKPSETWDEALPIGNGRLGAMVFGQATDERLQLNEDSVWAGERRARVNPRAAAAIPEIRRLLASGQASAAEALADEAVIARPRRLPPYQTLGDLLLRFAIAGDVSEYRRQLDLDTAVMRVRFRAGGTVFTRELFASAVDGVIVVRVTKEGPAPITFTAALRRERDVEVRARGDRLEMNGQAIARTSRHAEERATGVRFHAAVRVAPEGGEVRAEGDALTVTAATAVTLYVTAATDAREDVPADTCRRALDAAAAKPYARLETDHIADYQRLFRRVTLAFDARVPHAPTDERLAAVRNGAIDPALEALYFQYGRYLLIASSRPDSMAANLQGLWNDSLSPSWDSKYTININTEMNYWPAEVTNLAELHEPLFDLIDNARPDGRRVAREMYGAGGFVLHHNTDFWGHAVPIDGARWACGRWAERG